VEEAEWIETTAGARFRVSIFLSVFDVHVNRVPISGKVTLMEYREGHVSKCHESGIGDLERADPDRD